MTTIRYCIYARKSSEQDEKQAMSIKSQFREMRKIQEAEELDVVKIIEECKSAKTSFSRPGFTQLMAGLMDGEYEGILTWAVDRLSRNAGDLGMLVDLMYLKIIPWVVDILNILVSIGYNVLKLILYVFPAFGLSLILGILITLFFHKRHHDIRL